ncbi:MAG: GNVR domain-containing protein, partial [Kovacikia sp.]
VFQQRLDALRKDDGIQRFKFIQPELVKAEERLKRAQEILVEFQRNTNLVDSESQTKELVTTISSLIISQGQLVGQFQASKTRVETLSERLKETPSQAIASLRLTENPNYQEVQQKLAKLEVSLIAARAIYTDDSPKVQNLLLEREALLRRQTSHITKAAADSLPVEPALGETYAELVKELILAESQTNALKQQYVQLQNQIDQLNAQLSKIPAARARLLQLQRQYSISEGVYNGLVAQTEATRVNGFSTYPSVQILDEAASNPVPSGPGRKPVILGAILAALFGSIAIALFLESRDPLLTNGDFQKQGIPLLGKIPRLKGQRKGQRKGLGNVIDPQLDDELEFQRLASAISLMPLRQGRLMITSASAHEGKTTVTLGLAIALLKLGFRVLMVDADFDRVELTKRVGHFQPEKIQLKPQLVELCPGIDLLTPNLETNKEAEYIARGDLEQLLNFVQNNSEYDYILIDTLAISSANEPVLMTRSNPDVLLVVQPGLSKRLPLIDSIHQIRRNKAKILGLVINCTESNWEDYPSEPHEVEVER